MIEDEVTQKGKLFLWAEPLKPELPTRPRKTNIHPYALSSKEILTCLKVPATPHQQTLLLPSYGPSSIALLSISLTVDQCRD